MNVPIATPPPSPRAADDAAERLSAYFMRRFLTEAKVGEGLVGGSGGPGGHFSDMLRDALANAMSEGDALGLGAALRDPAADGLEGEEIGSTLAALHAHANVGRPDPRVATSPVAGSISSSFGLRAHPMSGHRHHHTGVDLVAPTGTPVVSSGDGIVVRAEDAGSYGNLVVVDHGDGLETRYAHLDEISVEVGAKIEAGAALGTVGETGRTTGPHLHFEVRRHGNAENPLRVVSGLNGAAMRSR